MNVFSLLEFFYVLFYINERLKKSVSLVKGLSLKSQRMNL